MIATFPVIITFIGVIYTANYMRKMLDDTGLDADSKKKAQVTNLKRLLTRANFMVRKQFDAYDEAIFEELQFDKTKSKMSR